MEPVLKTTYISSHINSSTLAVVVGNEKQVREKRELIAVFPRLWLF